MPDTLTAKVARTAHDLDHINRLRIVRFGVTELRVAAKSTRSISYLSDGSEDKNAAAKGANDFHFAPGPDKDGKTIDPVEIVYYLDDPRALLTKAKLELFRPKKEAPIWTLELDVAGLNQELLQHGEHRLKWDGCLATKVVKTEEDGKPVYTLAWENTTGDANAECPYVSVEYSAYKLRLTVGGPMRGDPPMAWTFFHVLVDSIDLELGPVEVAPLDRDKALHASLGGALPAEGAAQSVYLVSNIFKTASAEMQTNAGYEQYRAAWGQRPANVGDVDKDARTGRASAAVCNGPNIPIFAKVWIQPSQGNKVNAPCALGKAKFLWDWETPADQDLSGLHPRAQTFVRLASDYLTTHTKPRRDNCHLVRGGRRGDDALTVFPSQSGYTAQTPLKTDDSFPFKVVPYDSGLAVRTRDDLALRKWGAFSFAWSNWKNQDHAGKTGVLFQPSRMAGDRFKVNVYLCCETKDVDTVDDTVTLDVDTVTPLKVNAKIKKSTGTFEIWRDEHLVNYKKKKNDGSIININIGTVQTAYQRAKIRLQDNSGGVTFMDAVTYNQAIADAVTLKNNAGEWWYELMLDPGTDQHATDVRFLTFRNHGAWRAAVQAKVNTEAWSGPQINAFNTSTQGQWYTSANSYNTAADNFAMWAYPRVVARFMSNSPGVNIFQFLNTHNLPGGTGLNGFAVNMPAPERNKCGFIQCGNNYGGNLPSGLPNLNSREQTTTHEIGHHHFLPHTWQVSAAHDPEESHDAGDNACTMSYEFDKDRKFCGFCLLRLRGWSKFETAADGTPTGTRTLLKTANQNRKTNP